MRDVRPRKLAQLALIGARALPENNEGVRRLAPALMRQPNDRHLLHCGVSQEHTFDFDRGDVFSAADDDVFQAVAYLDITIRMDDRGIAGAKPSAAQCTLGRFWIVIVAGHDDVAARYDFALGNSVARHVVVFLVNHPQLARGDQLDALPGFDRRSLTNREGRVFRPLFADGDERRRLGESVNVV